MIPAKIKGVFSGERQQRGGSYDAFLDFHQCLFLLPSPFPMDKEF